MVDRQFIAAGFFLIIPLLLPANVFADEQFVRNQTIGILGEGLAAIKAVSDSSELETINKIKLRVPIDPAPVRVFAFRQSSIPVIEISTGYAVISRMIISGYLIESMLGIKDFGEDYARYTANTYGTGNLSGGVPPWDRAGLAVNQKKILLNNAQFNAAQEGTHMVALWYVLAHEIAHHVLEHEYHTGMSVVDIRKQEKEADIWAAKTLMKIGIPPAAAFPAHMYWYYLDEFGVKNEIGRTHPADLKRIRWLIQETLNEFDIWNTKNDIFPKMEEQPTRTAYRKLLVHVENLISQQVSFDDVESSVEFQICLDVKYEICIESCQKKYGHPLSACKNNFCNSEKTVNIRKLRCKELVK